jgi:8-oxo-dGTP pyrophosphatase MutT (NUDIX family)
MKAPFALVPASYVYLRHGDQVLLQRRANTGYMDGFWVAGAAGHVDPGETAAVAASREATEELGIHVHPGDLSFLTVMHRTDGTQDPREQRVDWFWTATRWTGTPQITEPQKCSGLDWYALDDLPEKIPAYERLVLDRWWDGALEPVTSYGFGSS